MRTIELKEATELTMQQLIAMSDSEVAELAALHAREPYYPEGIKARTTPITGHQESIDIRKTWRTVSRIEQGLSPKN